MTTRSTLLKRAVASLTAAGTVLAGAVLLSTAPAEAALKKVPTPFNYQGSSWGTRVSVGDPQSGGLVSGRTAWSVLACTTMAPLTHDQGSFVGKVDAPDYISIGAVRSRTSSYRKPTVKVFGSKSVNKVADIVLGSQDGPRLTIGALTTVARAYHDNGHYRATTDLSLADLDTQNITPADGTPLDALVDAINAGKDQAATTIIETAGPDGITIPGLGTIYLAGKQTTKIHSGYSSASAYGIRVELDNGSTVSIGRAWAKISDATPAGVFGGEAYALVGEAADGNLGIGRTPFQPLPCSGTDGEWRKNVRAEAGQAGSVQAAGLKAETYGRAYRDGRGVARARSALTTLTVGPLEIKGVVGQVNVVQNKAGHIAARTKDGTTVGEILVNGEPQSIPTPGDPLVIDGVARIEAGRLELLGTRGARIHALHIELLDGSGLVLDLGTARARISH